MPPPPPRPKLTHFLCIPLVTISSKPQLQASLSKFRNAVKAPPPSTASAGRRSSSSSPSSSPDRGSSGEGASKGLTSIPEKAIRPLGTLHLTLGVMSLITEDQIQGALALLRGLDLKALLSASAKEASALVSETKKGKTAVQNSQGDETGDSEVVGLKITLKGLESMHEASSTTILYSSPTDVSGRIYAFASALKQAFVKSGFMVAEDRKLLLHATIVNTVYVPAEKASGRGRGGTRGARGGRRDGYGHGKRKSKLTIDARKVLEEWGDFVWMQDVDIERVEICKMGAKVDGKGEERYEVQGGIDMPGFGAAQFGEI